MDWVFLIGTTVIIKTMIYNHQYRVNLLYVAFIYHTMIEHNTGRLIPKWNALGKWYGSLSISIESDFSSRLLESV
jgi:hypothetical protein